MGLSKLMISARILPKLHYTRILSRGCCIQKQESEEPPHRDKPLDGSKKGLVLGVYEHEDKLELTPDAEEINQKSGGKISQHLNELSYRMKLGKAFVVTDVVPEYSAVALASLGPKDAGYNKLEELDEARENVRCAVGAAVRALGGRGCGAVEVCAPLAEPAAEAAELAAWRFEEFKSGSERRGTCTVGPSRPDTDWESGAALGRAQNWARYLSDMPGNKMAPVDFAQAALDKLCPLGVAVSVHDRDWIEAHHMQGFLAVARGSCETPVLLEATYTGAENSPPVLIAAKGVTFDSGGLCLKRPRSMVENRGSMAGAAVAVAAMHFIAEAKLPINVSCVIPLCENMVSGQCMKVGDVVKALNGLSIQIEDTDMEGRLMLADALVYGQAVHKPALVIDVATLTHGVLLAMGGGAFGCFSNSEAAWTALRAAGAQAGDRGWRLPLWDYYRQQLTNDSSVDLRNKGSGRATPCLGAAFLKHFVCGAWLHLDVTGVGKLGHSAPPYLRARRMSGRPTRTLAYFLRDAALAPPTAAPQPANS